MYFFSLFLFLCVCSSGIYVWVLYSWGLSVESKLSPDVLSWGGRWLFCCTRHLLTENCKPLISISRISRHSTNSVGRSRLWRSFSVLKEPSWQMNPKAKLLMTNYVFCIVQRAIEHWKTGV
jgi:hypothetical protein